MASITGGNVLVMATITLGVMLVVLVLFFLSAFNFDRWLTVSWADLTVGKTGAEEMVKEEAAGNGVVTEVPELDPEAARQLLGFIEYPVVRVRPNAESLFSPEREESGRRLSEEEIEQRCAFISISFNRERCLKAERDCADNIASEEEHWGCLASHDFWIGKRLTYLSESTR